MIHFLSLADHYGTAVHVIGGILAGFFIGLILGEIAMRALAHVSDRQRRNEQRFNERKDAMLARLTRERPA